MIINYCLLSPSKNYTVLVTTPVEEKYREKVSSEILKKEALAEQLGYVSIDGDVVLLNMAGGEFCGNACRAASFLTDKNTVLCSDQTIKCEGTAAYIPRDVKGIKVYVYDKKLLNENSGEYYESEIKKMAAGSGEATGIMFLDESDMTVIPLVYVPGIDTLFWENCCASGSAVVADYLVKKYNKAIDCEFKEPGGVISVKASPESDVVKLDGKITILKIAEIDIDL